MDQQTAKKLRDNYDQIKPQLQARFPDVSESDLQKAKTDPDGFADTVAKQTGQDKRDVQEQIKQVAQTV